MRERLIRIVGGVRGDLATRDLVGYNVADLLQIEPRPSSFVVILQF